MSGPKFTRGPWFYQPNADAYTHIIRPSGNPGIIIAHCSQSSAPQVKADAHLIAAAPLLYQALKEMTMNFRFSLLLMNDEESRKLGLSIVESAEKVIAAAEGEP